ncbi:hypothetical protein KC19_VG260400 [Ceratodon purpureus]|uniref:Uncharacterized protein n=1 Tax=Ceratodon purpureus TaxID=3225 RepID=A0A8T0HUD7_CERPU|nr:hypothetical protein KC19_VG260400 [Ceratodon purpureus]
MLLVSNVLSEDAPCPRQSKTDDKGRITKNQGLTRPENLKLQVKNYNQNYSRSYRSSNRDWHNTQAEPSTVSKEAKESKNTNRKLYSRLNPRVIPGEHNPTTLLTKRQKLHIVTQTRNALKFAKA